MNPLRLPLLAVALFFLTLAAVAVGDDAMLFHDVQSGTYSTPWYDVRWWRNPYTSLRVLAAGSQTRWAKNAAGDDWLIRESVIDGKTWWTVVQKNARMEAGL